MRAVTNGVYVPAQKPVHATLTLSLQPMFIKIVRQALLNEPVISSIDPLCQVFD
jgi:hypothetical protein